LTAPKADHPPIHAAFDAVFNTTIIGTPVRGPRVNAIAERFVGTLRHELLDRTASGQRPRDPQCSHTVEELHR
jgi:hypothetical protein